MGTANLGETLREMTREEYLEHERRQIERRFEYHKPDELRAALHNSVNRAMLEIAYAMLDLTPEGRGQSLGFTKLEEARMWFNQAIATATDAAIDRTPTVARGKEKAHAGS